MESDEEIATAVVALLLAKRKNKRERSVWVKPWLVWRINLGFYETLVAELRFEDKSQYKNFCAWHHTTLGLIQDDITIRNTNIRDSVPAKTNSPPTIRF